MRSIFLSGIAMTLFTASAMGQCGPNGCPPMYTPNYAPVWHTAPSQPTYQAAPTWRVHPTNADQWVLWDGGRQLGNWSLSGQFYRPLVGAGWGAICEPPTLPPVVGPLVMQEASYQQPPTGVEWDKINSGEKHSVNGQQVTKLAAYQSLNEKGQLADDSSKQRVTIISSDAGARKAALDMFESGPLSAWKAKVVIRAYPPDHWHVQAVGFKGDGKPTIYVQAPSGKVLHRQDDLVGGADGLTSVLTKASTLVEGVAIGAIRRPDGTYDARKDPDLRQQPKPNEPAPALPGTIAFSTSTAILLALLAIPVALLIYDRLKVRPT